MEVFKRTRDFVRNMRPVGKITAVEWNDIVDRYNFAKKFLDVKNHAYNLMTADLENARDIILENRVHSVQDRKMITDSIMKVFITPKKEQLNELVGQYKYIKGFLKELQSWIERKETLEKEEAQGKITIDRPKKNE